MVTDDTESHRKGDFSYLSILVIISRKRFYFVPVLPLVNSLLFDIEWASSRPHHFHFHGSSISGT